MIGDSLDADVQGALDMGLTLFFFNEKTQIGESYQVNHLLELKNLPYEKIYFVTSVRYCRKWLLAVCK
jgi:FMN phosphatase YigB (HAD superfamily)